MRKFERMTNKEWVLKTFGVFDIDSCPYHYGLDNSLGSGNCPNNREWSIRVCEKCWNLPARRCGRYFLKEIKNEV